MLFKILAIATILPLSMSCDMVKKIEKRAQVVNNANNAALALAKENRILKAEISRLEYEIESLKSVNNYMKIQLEQNGKTRGPASVAPVSPRNDMVKFGTYKWSPAQMLAMAEKEFSRKNYEKSAQFFQTFIDRYPNHKNINDQFLFQAGVAAYESGKHDQWVFKNLGTLVREFPTSPYYRGAKLWMALTHLKQGKQDKFFNTVEEFRKKYRNTSEWEILSSHYEKMLQKYKK